MDFMQAVKSVLGNYANFNDRSGRSELWWWWLAYFVAYLAIYMLGGILGAGEILANLLALGLLIPNIAVAVRRFHDIGKSGWWVLIAIVPILGLIALIYFFVQPSEGPNKYGEAPLKPVA